MGFVLVGEDGEIITTNRERATGYFYIAFTQEQSEHLYGLAMLVTQEGEERYSDLLLSDERRTIMFLRSIGGAIK